MLRELTPASALLVAGGDYRIALDNDSHCNRYGCQPFPAADRISFGSSTGSQISPEAFDAVERLRKRLEQAWAAEPNAEAAGSTVRYRRAIYESELARVRTTLLDACGLFGDNAPELVFASSGTDAHLIAAQLIAARARRCLPAPRALRIIMVNAEESGSGVTKVLSGRTSGLIAGRPGHDLIHVSLRELDGTCRPAAAINADVEALTTAALTAGLNVLLVLVDVSKTGCVAPEPQFTQMLRLRDPERIHVLVDACQFRLEAASLRAYLHQDWMVAVTGSKFIGGPSFSAALLLPLSIAASMRCDGVPRQLAGNSSLEEWPQGWHANRTLASHMNIGMLLRWEAALCELQAFRAIPESRIRNFLLRFGEAVRKRLRADAHFERLAAPDLPRRAAGLTPAWDDVQTIHAFTLHRTSPQRQPFYLPDVLALYRRLQQTRHVDGCVYVVGQPVISGMRGGVETAALRLSVNARMIVQACTGDTSTGAAFIIERAMRCLDAIAALIDGV